MLIYVRHSDDEVDDATFKHDPKLTDDGRKLAQSKGDKIIEKYGQPTIIYCSPFRRTKETLDNMLSNLTDEQRENIKIYYVSNQSRYFSSKEKRNPQIAKSTKSSHVPIYESYHDFEKRVKKSGKKLEKYIRSKQIVWVITHTTVYKRTAKNYSIKLPNYIPFMHSFRVKGKWCKTCEKYHYQ